MEGVEPGCRAQKDSRGMNLPAMPTTAQSGCKLIRMFRASARMMMTLQERRHLCLPRLGLIALIAHSNYSMAGTIGKEYFKNRLFGSVKSDCPLDCPCPGRDQAQEEGAI